MPRRQRNSAPRAAKSQKLCHGGIAAGTVAPEVELRAAVAALSPDSDRQSLQRRSGRRNRACKMDVAQPHTLEEYLDDEITLDEIEKIQI